MAIHPTRLSALSIARPEMSPKKFGLSINTAAANRSSDERVFETDSSEPSSAKPPKKSGKKLKVKKSQSSLKQFKDDDPQMKALEQSFLNAPRPAPPLPQVTHPLLQNNNRAPNRQALNRNLSVLSYDTDASHGSGMSSETIKPSSYQRDASGRTTGRLQPPHRNLKHAHSTNALCVEKNLGEAYFNGQEDYHPNTLSTLYIDEHSHPPAYGRIARKPLPTAETNLLPLPTPGSGPGQSGHSPDTSVANVKPGFLERPQPSPTSTYSDGEMAIPRKPVPEFVASYPYFHTIVTNSPFDVVARKAKETKAKESFASTSTTMSVNTDSFRSSTGNNHESFTSESSVDSQEAERRAEERRRAERQREAQLALSAQIVIPLASCMIVPWLSALFNRSTASEWRQILSNITATTSHGMRNRGSIIRTTAVGGTTKTCGA